MLYSILFCLPAITALGGAIYLLARKKRSHVTNTMAYVLFFLSISIFCYAQYYNPVVIEKQTWGFDLLYSVLAPFCAPLYFLFLNRLTLVRKTPTRDVLAFVPSLIFVIFIVLAYLLATDAERHAYIGYITQGQVELVTTNIYKWLVLVGYQVCRILLGAQIILVILYGEFRLKSYVKLLEDYYSSIDNTDVIRIRGIHAMSIMILILALSLALLPTHEWNSSLFLAIVIILLEVVILIRIVNYSDKVDYTAESLREMLESTPNEQSDATSAGEGVLHTIIERMDNIMSRDKLFLNPSLSLMMLSETIGTNRTYVSQAIKIIKGCNFSDYVNRYRIEYALELMSSRPYNEIVIQNIAVECGCGSTQTFYRYFKMFFGTTPTAWLEGNRG